MILDFLKSSWRRLRRRTRYKRIAVVDSMSAIPERLGGTIYIVRRGGIDRRAAFECPCRCGRTIDLNLFAGSRQPSWSVTTNKGTVTVHPSVWLRSDPCQSHFFIRRNKVIWT